MKPSEILRAAKAKIENPENWTQHALARDRRGRDLDYRDFNVAQSFCAIGALCSIAGPNMHDVAAREYLDRAAVLAGITDDPDANDWPSAMFNDSRSHAEVMALYTRAIQLAEQESS